MKHFGADISEGAGSRVRVYLNGARAVFHRPHPHSEAGKAQVESVRRFLVNPGIMP
ncbi:MAG: type II toxin-antitoxin system HicA family toxin [Thermoguttaceae bacterium]